MSNQVSEIINLLKGNSSLREEVVDLKERNGALNKYMRRGEKMKSVSRRKNLVNEV